MNDLVLDYNFLRKLKTYNFFFKCVEYKVKKNPKNAKYSNSALTSWNQSRNRGYMSESELEVGFGLRQSRTRSLI